MALQSPGCGLDNSHWRRSLADGKCGCGVERRRRDLRWLASGRRLDIAHAQLRADEAKGLADPTRLTLAAALIDGGELCVCDLAWVLERAENLVSDHLRQLRSAGLVRSSRDGKMVMYSLTDRGRELLEVALADSVPA